jgi:pyruvate dehydrogenase E2 component (dihydrolipoamide acetyltransferase)
MVDLKIPEVGENVESGVVTSVMVSEGDMVSKDQPLLELETDKATIEIPAEKSGRVHQILVKKGDKIRIGQVFIQLESKSAFSSEAKTDLIKTQEPESPQKESIKREDTAPLAAAPLMDQDSIKSVEPLSFKELIDVPAAPSVRRFAREIGIRIVDVPGSGPDGRIFKEDVKKYSKQLNEKRYSQERAGKALPHFSTFGVVRREPMNTIRKKTIENLSHAHASIPPVTAFDEADITELEVHRKNISTETVKLSLTPFLVMILGRALQAFPKFNASIDIDREEVVYKEYINIGIAVETERGLIVPVVKNASQKSITQLAQEISNLAEKARQKKIMPDDLAGGCITLTNLGGIGGSGFTPIVFWPEVAILGVSRGKMHPVWNGREFIARLILPLSLSYDHRLIDGADGARFLSWVCTALEQAPTLTRQSRNQK